VPARIGGPAPARIGPIAARAMTRRQSAGVRASTIHGGAASSAGAVSGGGAGARPCCAGGTAGGSVASTTASMNSMIAGCSHHDGGPGGADGGRGGAPVGRLLTLAPDEPSAWDRPGPSAGPGPRPRSRSIRSMASPSGLRLAAPRACVEPGGREQGGRELGRRDGRSCHHARLRPRQRESLCCRMKKIIRAMIWAIQAGVTSGASGPYRSSSGAWASAGAVSGADTAGGLPQAGIRVKKNNLTMSEKRGGGHSGRRRPPMRTTAPVSAPHRS